MVQSCLEKPFHPASQGCLVPQPRPPSQPRPHIGHTHLSGHACPSSQGAERTGLESDSGLSLDLWAPPSPAASERGPAPTFLSCRGRGDSRFRSVGTRTPLPSGCTRKRSGRITQGSFLFATLAGNSKAAPPYKRSEVQAGVELGPGHLTLGRCSVVDRRRATRCLSRAHVRHH